MPITSRELIELVQSTIPAAAPAERTIIETYIAMIDRDGIIATLDSDHSQFLDRTTTNFIPHWEPSVASQFKGVQLYGVPVPYINAFARVEDGIKQVILFEGIKQVVMFYAHLRTILNLLQTYRSERRININGWQEKESAAFSLAAFSLLDDYMRNGNSLIGLGDILGPIALQNVNLGYEAAIAFVLAHEVGHLALGHIRAGAISERHDHRLAIPETINAYQEKEFEADRYALFAFNEQLRVILMSSVIFFFGAMAFMEAFGGDRDGSHPLFTNRAAHLASLLPHDTEDGIKVANVIRSQTDGYRRLDAMRGPDGLDLRPRIHQTIPVEFAHRVIKTVKETVLSEVGVLDFPG